MLKFVNLQRIAKWLYDSRYMQISYQPVEVIMRHLFSYSLIWMLISCRNIRLYLYSHCRLNTNINHSATLIVAAHQILMQHFRDNLSSCKLRSDSLQSIIEKALTSIDDGSTPNLYRQKAVPIFIDLQKLSKYTISTRAVYWSLIYWFCQLPFFSFLNKLCYWTNYLIKAQYNSKKVLRSQHNIS